MRQWAVPLAGSRLRRPGLKLLSTTLNCCALNVRVSCQTGRTAKVL